MSHAFSESDGPRPLVVDLDGTLIASDLLIESFFALFSRDPVRALAALPALLKGKAAFKAKIAQDVTLDCASLPVNQELADFLRGERLAGRRIYLASASDRKLVEATAAALGPFDGVFASDGKTNLSAERKARRLLESFGHRGFDYAGNARADIPVWDVAHSVIVIGAAGRFKRKTEARFPSARHMDAPKMNLRVLARALRVHQWLKNLLLFGAAVAAHRFSSDLIPPLLMAFFSFSFAASSAYLANDLLDLRSDRSHPRKKNRPLASGRMPLVYGIVLAPLMLAAALLLAWQLPREFLALLCGYYLLTSAYSLFLKRMLIVDVMALACLYGVRLVGGAMAADVPLTSPWFVSFAVFVFLCLAIVKRCTEILDRMNKGDGNLPGRGYIQRDLPILEAMAAATGYVAIMIFTLYISSPAVLLLYRSPQYLWAICLVLFYWISRILLLAHRGEMHEDPVVYAVTDRQSLICGILLAVIVLMAI